MRVRAQVFPVAWTWQRRHAAPRAAGLLLGGRGGGGDGKPEVPLRLRAQALPLRRTPVVVVVVRLRKETLNPPSLSGRNGQRSLADWLISIASFRE